MNLSKQIAKHLRDVHFGGNWTSVNLKQELSDVTWEEAVTKLYSFNTIATLVFHMNYFFPVVIRVLEGGPLEGNDKLSFNTPEISNNEQWQSLVNTTLDNAVKLASLIEDLPEEKFDEIFSDEKYGNYYRNLTGIVEHCHYHLGQIVILKKLIRAAD